MITSSNIILSNISTLALRSWEKAQKFPVSVKYSSVEVGTGYFTNAIYRFLSITNLMHLFMYLFIYFISLQVSSIKCSSSGDRIVLIYHLVWLVCISGCFVCRSFPPDGHTKRPLTKTNHTRWCINTIRSPDDEHLMLETCREMKWINKYMKMCIRLVIDKNL